MSIALLSQSNGRFWYDGEVAWTDWNDPFDVTEIQQDGAGSHSVAMDPLFQGFVKH
jgi:hypothetical protein